MIRFSRIFDPVTEVERRKLAQAQEIYRKAFPETPAGPEALKQALERRTHLDYEVVLLTVEEDASNVLGFAFLHYYPGIRCAYLDAIATDPASRRRGLGSALYEGLREYLVRKGARGLYMDVPPDDPAVVHNPALLALNQRRLRFYEHYGALPIADTRYDQLPPGESGYHPPLLVFDGLGRSSPPARAEVRRAMRAILSLKYHWDPDGPYTRSVLASLQSDPVQLRPRRYTSTDGSPAGRSADHGRLRSVQLLVSDRHQIHHVRERGYVERPVRVPAILKGLEDLGVQRWPVRHHSEQAIRAVHDGDYVSYLANLCTGLAEDDIVYPYVFPIRRPERKPRDRATRAGYYCIDTFTPLSRSAYLAARDAVDCALTGAELVLKGHRIVYALCRPPGHHAERRVFGGFCYFNNAAIAAHRLSKDLRVALLDIDYHHGNGSQDIFYRRSDVLTVSIHGHPNHSYPYFSGFPDERGEGEGRGFNRNFPLPEHGVDDARYLQVLALALAEVKRFRPTVLVVSLGLDIMRNDPTGGFLVTSGGMGRIGEALGRMALPTLVVQEGGYLLRNLSSGSRAFFTGFVRTAL